MKLTAIHSPFTTFCEGPEDIEKGFRLFRLFYKRNYLSRLPRDKNIKILVVSSGVGYFQFCLKEWGYKNIKGVDSDKIKVDYAQKKGYKTECINCFEFLETIQNEFDLIFVEQEVNHLTREEFRIFLNLCFLALKDGGKLILTAANCANPFISSEYLGNNIDHYMFLTENSMRQFFSLTQFRLVEVFPHDFYVLWKNPLNYIAKALTSIIHVVLKIIFKMYGKSNTIFTKRFGVIAIK